MIVSGTPIRESVLGINSDSNATPTKTEEPKNEEQPYDIGLRIFNSCLNTIVHGLIMVTVVVCMWYGFRTMPMNETQKHVVLCVLGYQFFITEAILSFSNNNTWSSMLKYKHRKMIHWVMQVIGFILGITGIFIKSLSKDVNFNTNHGQSALCVAIISSVAILNGTATFFAYDLRNLIPANISKISHIFIGSITLILSTTTLCLGLDKNTFRSWSKNSVADMLIVFNVLIVCIVLISPAISVTRKIKAYLK